MGFRFGLRTAVPVMSVIGGLIVAGEVSRAAAAGAETHKVDVVVLAARDLNLLNRITWG